MSAGLCVGGGLCVCGGGGCRGRTGGGGRGVDVERQAQQPRRGTEESSVGACLRLQGCLSKSLASFP